MLPLLAAYMGASALSSMGKGHGLSQVPLIGGFFSDPAQEEYEQQLKQNAAAWEARRPVIAQNAENMMGQIHQAYAPVRGAMAQLYDGQMQAPPEAPPQQAPNFDPAVVGSQLMGPQAPPQGATYSTTQGPMRAVNDTGGYQNMPQNYRGLPGYGGR